MKVLTREEMSTVADMPSSEMAGVNQNINGHQAASGNQMRPNRGQLAALTTTM